MTKKEFEQKLRDIGKERYHDNCKFHHLLHSGMLNKGQVQAWALNRYYYQINISIKDSALMSRIKDPELRRVWVKRILDHDGRKDDEGGIERWYKLTDGLDNVLSLSISSFNFNSGISKLSISTDEGFNSITSIVLMLRL